MSGRASTHRLVLTYLSVLVIAACADGPVTLPSSFGSSLATDPDLRVAFIGDQGLNSNSRAVLQLILDEGSDMVLHQGDFDYGDDPTAWDSMIDGILGADFPYFASVGNHDVSAWDGANGYQSKLEARLERIPDAACVGDLGVKASCRYRGLFFILSGIGTMGSGHESFLRDQLAADSSVWSICSWHKNQTSMQVGGKGNEVGWGAYEECREGGAIVATGHEHSYSRTYLMDSFGPTQIVASDSSTLVLEKGRSFAFVSGLGGHSVRPQQISGPWWASIYTSTQGALPGALFCTFHVGNDPNRAWCFFKAIDGSVVDSFELVSAVND